MTNVDALESGSMGNAFLFTDTDVEEEQSISRQVGFVLAGAAAPSLADANTLLKMKVNLPGPEDSIRAVRRMQGILSQTFWGNTTRSCEHLIRIGTTTALTFLNCVVSRESTTYNGSR